MVLDQRAGSVKCPPSVRMSKTGEGFSRASPQQSARAAEIARFPLIVKRSAGPVPARAQKKGPDSARGERRPGHHVAARLPARDRSRELEPGQKRSKHQERLAIEGWGNLQPSFATASATLKRSHQIQTSLCLARSKPAGSTYSCVPLFLLSLAKFVPRL